MADNVQLSAGTADGAVIATDDIGPGVHYQIIKLSFGALDTATLVSTTNGLPVQPATSSTWTVDNGGTFVVQEDGAALTALQLLDDVVHNGDAAASKYALIGAVLDDAATAAVSENQAQALRMSSRRALLVEGVASGTALSTNWNGTAPPIGAGTEAAALRVTIATDSTGVVSIDDNGGALTVDGTVAVTSAALTTLAGAVAGTEVQVDVLTMPTVTVTATDLDIRDLTSVSDSVAAVQSGTWDVGTVTTVTTVSAVTAISNALPAGDNNIGNFDLVSLPAGNLGQQAMAASLSVTPANNITDATYIGDIKFGEALPAGTAALGKLLAPDIDITTHTNYMKKYYTYTGAVTDGIVWSPGAGKRWHVVSLYVQTSAAATVTFEDDLAAGDSGVLAGEFAANGGGVIHFGEKYPLASGEDAADLLVTTSAGNIYVTVVGYEI